MTKKEYIERYGEEAYQKKLEGNKKWALTHREQLSESSKKWYYEHHEQAKETSRKYRRSHNEQHNEANKAWMRKYRNLFAYVLDSEKEQIENYEKALADNFDGWDLHHKYEITYGYSRKELIDLGLYYNRPACELIFLTHAEHTKLHRRK